MLHFYVQNLRKPKNNKGRSSRAINDGPVKPLGSDPTMATTFSSGWEEEMD